MQYIAHRINTIDQLIKIPTNYGVEIDLRDKGEDIILQHDPFKGGVNFANYLKNYKHDLIILNIKSERIEFKIIEYLRKYHVNNYFFLDCSFPMIYQLIKIGETKIALRYSEYEGIDTILNLKEKVEWIWVDCFTQFPVNQKIYNELIKYFKLCLVSPELQGHPLSMINDFSKKMIKMPFNAICTKRIDLWEKSFLKND